MLTPSNTNYDHQLTISSLNELTVTSIGAVSGNSGTSQGWMNTVPLSTSATNTLNKRTANNLRMKRQNGNANQDLYVKDYIKKRILILDLLVRSYFTCYFLQFEETMNSCYSKLITNTIQ